MTDKEIIKALECCFVQRNHSECPLKGFGFTVVDCRYELAHHVITLITARKSQIEDLKEALEERMQRIKELKAEAKSETAKKEIAADCIKQQGEEIERLKERLDAKCDICIERDKTAAIREFAERLKEDISSHRLEMFMNGLKGTPISHEITYECVEEYIDTLVKELTEETDNV